MEKKIFKRVMMLFILIGVMSMVTVFASDITNQTISNTSMENTNHTILQNQVQVETQTQPIEQTTSNQQGLNNHDIGLLAVALSTGLACIGAGIAVAVVASSAIGAISENPNLLGKTIIFAGLAEGIAIYGLIISIMILNKI